MYRLNPFSITGRLKSLSQFVVLLSLTITTFSLKAASPLDYIGGAPFLADILQDNETSQDEADMAILASANITLCVNVSCIDVPITNVSVFGNTFGGGFGGFYVSLAVCIWCM